MKNLNGRMVTKESHQLYFRRFRMRRGNKLGQEKKLSNYVSSSGINAPTQKIPDITFTSKDFDAKAPNLDDLVVISITTRDLLIRKVLLDQGSSANIMFLSTFKKMQLNEKALQPSSGELVGFSGERIPVTGYIWVRTTLGEPPHSKTLDIQYLIVDCFSPYNIILGRPSLNAFGVIVSTIHLCVKFCSEVGTIATVHSDRKEARQCYNAGLKVQQPPPMRINSIYNASDMPDLSELDPRTDHEQRPTPADDLSKVTLTDDGDKYTNIGSSLPVGHARQLTDLLRANTNLFAWTPADMTGIHPEVMCHRLALDPNARPIRQKKRQLGQEKTQAATKETQKLLSAGFIREIQFTSWLANIVMVKKNLRKWRMCVDFTDLNRACPKDFYPLPCNDKLIDNTSGYQVLTFMDAYSGYN
ncbi:uncharacterized protein [Arachis hypogaea]|uniref:uncharacterized protein n=1 Tax=Arachis hypogaea TaxID=3818 RepID=UPI003B218290